MTTEPSRADAREYLRAAEQALKEAAILFDEELLNGAVSRTYFALLYAASAALLAERVKLPKKSETLITLFYKHLVTNGIMPSASHQTLVKAFNLRQQSDYEIHSSLEFDEVGELFQDAGVFIDEVKAFVDNR